MSSKLSEDSRYGNSYGTSQLAKTLAVYDRPNPVIKVAGSDFNGTSPKIFWQEVLMYLLPGAEINQMLTLMSDFVVRNAVWVWIVVVFRWNEQSSARSSIAWALEKLRADAKQDLGGVSDVVCCNERGAGIGGFSIGVKNKGGSQIITRLCRHATSSWIRVLLLNLLNPWIRCWSW